MPHGINRWWIQVSTRTMGKISWKVSKYLEAGKANLRIPTITAPSPRVFSAAFHTIHKKRVESVDFSNYLMVINKE